MDELNEKDVDVAEEEEQEQEDDIITCPVCGEEVEVGTENCPLCGAPVGALENNDISGTSIDNSAAIDAMLQSAAMLVEESASLGVGSLDDEEDANENDEDDMAVEEEEEPEEEDEPDDVALEPIKSATVPKELTAEQVNQINSGGMININPGGGDEQPAPKTRRGAKPKPPKKEKEKSGSGPILYNIDELGNKLPDNVEPEPMEAPPAPPVQKKEPSKKEKKKGSSPVIVVLATVVALLLGCAVGFFVKTLFFPDYTVPECQEFAERAVLSVNSVLAQNEEIYIAEAYVKDSGDALQCVFRAFVDSGNDTADSCWYRVKVYKDTPDTVRVYLELDQEEYDALMSSGDQEKQIQASMLMSNQKELERCISEIKSGSWDAANPSALNNSLRPFTEK